MKKNIKKTKTEILPAPTFNTTIFTTALSAAKSRLEKALEERAEAQSKLSALDSEIPSLQRTIASLEGQLNPSVIDPNTILGIAKTSVVKGDMVKVSLSFDHTAPIPPGVGSIPVQVKVPAAPQPNMADEIKEEGGFR